ncbi:hypothetical protein DVH05_008901 [Phytophthora capsici]|nr:hypothetical protein DVH05_008901 [Phytophthora capsici]
METIEQAEQAARIQRAEDTRKRNAAAQNCPERSKKARNNAELDGIREKLDADAKAFYESIDDPLMRICGSCGELSKSARMVRKRYEPTANVEK